MIKKIVFLIACIFLFAINYNNESFAYTDEDQDIEISFVIPPAMFNNMLYSSVDDNSIYWVIDSQTFFASDYFYPYNYREGWLQPIETALSSGFFNYLDVEHNYIIFDIKAWDTAYLGNWSDTTSVAIFPSNTTFAGLINLNGPTNTYQSNPYKNSLTIESLINNLQLLNLTLQLDNQIHFENGFYNGSAFGYNNGYDEGYTQGLLDGSSEGQLETWNDGKEKGLAEGIAIGQEQGFDTGFIEGVSTAHNSGFERFSYSELSLLTDETSYTYYLGIYASDSEKFDAAFEQGRNYERANPHMFAWITALFSTMGAFLGIAILPGVTIGLIVAIPLLFGLVMFFIKLFRGS